MCVSGCVLCVVADAIMRLQVRGVGVVWAVCVVCVMRAGVTEKEVCCGVCVRVSSSSGNRETHTHPKPIAHARSPPPPPLRRW